MSDDSTTLQLSLSPTFRVDIFRQFEGLRCCYICVRWTDGKDNGVWILYVLETHIPDLLLYVLRLITDWNFRNTRQIYQSQCENTRREDLEVNRLMSNSLKYK